MFCGLRFKFVFYRILWVFWGHLGLHLAPYLIKNHSENRFKKRGPPAWNLTTISVSDGSQRRRLACALLNSNNSSRSSSCSISARARIVARIRVQVWVRNRKLARNWLLELASIANKSKTIRKNGKGWYQNSMLVIWHALGRGPANSWKWWKVEDEECPDIHFPSIKCTKAWIWI